jgi:hypothetical protein
MNDQIATRLKCLEMARPLAVAVPDIQEWIARATQLELYVHGAGQAVTPQHSPVANGFQKPGQSPNRGPATVGKR